MEPYGLQALTAFERLAYLKTQAFAGGQSSYDRSGGNADSIFYPKNLPNFLGQDGKGEDILLDLEGAGVVYRIWCTGFNYDTAMIKICIDGTIVTAPSTKLRYLFDGSLKSFVRPLVGTCPAMPTEITDAKDGGFYCYLPIPFRQSIKITVTGFTRTKDDDGFYYNIGYHKYASQTGIQSWSGNEDSTAAVELWNKVGQDPKPKSLAHKHEQPSDNHWVSNTIGILPGHSARLLDVPGPGSIAAIKIHAENMRLSGLSPTRFPLQDSLSNLWLRISWDGEGKPSVYAPLNMFFALGHFGYMAPSQNLAVGLENDWLYCYFPMPFERRATIDISNHSLIELEDISYEIHYTDFHDEFSNVGYFKVAFAQRSLAANTGSISLLEVDGAGHLVGVVESIEGPPKQQNPVWFLEGDERIYADDCRTPIIQGTGTEDFYNSGWYFDNGKPFSREMHGCTFYDVDTECRARVSAHRLFLQDAIPFRRNIRAVIEHGGTNDVSVQVWTLAYYYHQLEARATLCDFLEIGNQASESRHQYSSTNGEIVTGASSFEGDQNEVQITDSGREHQGGSQFVMSVPRDNQGIILRRMLDYSIVNQRAQVFVNNQLIGVWFTAGGNPYHCWREDDFLIPSTVTSGQNKIVVKIQHVPGSPDWTEFKYWAFFL